MYLPSKWSVLGLNLIQAWLFFFFVFCFFFACLISAPAHLTYITGIANCLTCPLGTIFSQPLMQLTGNMGQLSLCIWQVTRITTSKHNLHLKSVHKVCSFFFCFFFWTVSSILSSNFIFFFSVFGCIASAKEFLKPVEWKYWSRQRDGRTDRRKGRRNGGRAERGKDGWGGDKRRWEVARVMDSHTQCKGGKTEGRIAKKKERRKKGVSVSKEEA